MKFALVGLTSAIFMMKCALIVFKIEKSTSYLLTLRDTGSFGQVHMISIFVMIF